MNSIVKVFSNFKDFYNEINGATLTGAIDVIAVEQPDGSYQCSPFHVRFGKLGVLRSREKIVDIEVNGEPVDIHMKLGESGEAFFVEEVSEDDLEVLPEHMATSPIPTSEFEKNYDANNDNKDSNSNATTVNTLQIPKPRRNSIDLTSNGDSNSLLKVEDAEKATLKYENQMSDYVTRRHTDMGAIRPDLSATKREYTTQKLREEWQAEQDQLQQIQETIKANEELDENKHFRPIETEDSTPKAEIIGDSEVWPVVAGTEENKQDPKMKKKRRKKSVLKKKNQAQRKNSASSGSTHDDVEQDTLSVSISNTTLSSSTDSTPPNSGDVIDVASTPEDSVKEPLKEPETPNRVRELDLHFFSDTEVQSGLSPRGSRPSTPIQSDTEFEVSQREKNDDSMSNSASWKWGELPTQPEEIPGQTKEDAKQAQRNSMLGGMFSFMKQGRKLRKHNPEGLYLEDLENEDIDPEVAALYFPQHQRRVSAAKDVEGKGEDDRESGNGTSVPQSPTSMEGLKSLDSDYDEGKHSALDFVAISLCGGLEKGNPTEEEFKKHQLQFADICQDPAIFASPNLVVRLNGKYYSWTVACPIVMTLIIYQKPLPSDVCQQLDKLTKEQKEREKSSDEEANANEKASGSYSWWNWRRSGSQSVSSAQPPTSSSLPEARVLSKSVGDSNLAVGTQTSRANTPDDNSLLQISEKSNSNVKQNDSYNASMSSSNDSFDGTKLNDTSYINSSLGTTLGDEQQSNEKYRKSLRLTSKQIEKLNLKSGQNEVVFSVTTAYQGTSRCKCYLFKWKYNDKVVISDIDGTITRSDVLGHILPMVGKDWAQFGVAQLFSKIEQNGYKLLYLSARAIGQSRATREYLRSIRQGNVKLPDGPLLLNPTSLISAFHREVIERKPEQFKIACLSDIQALFPDKNPFYAGYGNRINDVWAYRAVGIPIMRIFTINTKGELKHELTQTFQSSYCGMAYIVDQLFPPLHSEESVEDIEYSSFNYWRDPVAELVDIDLNISNPSPSTSGTATPTNLNASQVLSNKSLPTIPENVKV
ncbi:phosphatidate phosphatase LPIN3 isoform X2 [Culicoides brevitarsis]|uniref:phosphatidate phosphatase LPIN3 isoform X2 n=1 Tax=Culicoides brevitarsis TaxID=469753 RepID=UPI00307C2A9A